MAVQHRIVAPVASITPTPPLSPSDIAAHLAASHVRRPAVLKPAPKAPRPSSLAVAA
ncbi:hypothetical protein [Streptomyces sp. NPDC088258]|uniref:hypothetical protein n=1 Tax=Streptomyces sp. NPDC088258 TaxID=3365849 RepID=UPI00380C5998